MDWARQHYCSWSATGSVCACPHDKVKKKRWGRDGDRDWRCMITVCGPGKDKKTEIGWWMGTEEVIQQKSLTPHSADWGQVHRKVIREKFQVSHRDLTWTERKLDDTTMKKWEETKRSPSSCYILQTEKRLLKRVKTTFTAAPAPPARLSWRDLKPAAPSLVEKANDRVAAELLSQAVTFK